MLTTIWTALQGVNLLFILFVLFFERKESTRRIAWLLILTGLPVVGMVLYVLFSGHLFTGTRRLRQASELAQEVTEPRCALQRKILREQAEDIAGTPLARHLPLISMNLACGNSLLSATESTRIYVDGAEFFDDLCAELERAEHTICMEYFIFRADGIGKRLMDILCRKAAGGVAVKLLYDDLGSLLTSTRFFRQLNAAGGTARAFFPIRLGLPFTLNYRNHRKLTVIDGRTAFIGGMNIGDEYANQRKHGRLRWRDTVLRMTGESVLLLQLDFLKDWYSQELWADKVRDREDALRYFPPEITADVQEALTEAGMRAALLRQTRTEGIPTQIVTSGPGGAQEGLIERSLIRMIMGAKKNVYIQTPYFTPDEGFCTALKIAAGSGVEIRILMPAQWDKFYVKAASEEFAREIAADGVRIFLYPGFIHSKMVTVDGSIATIGSTNIDVRSFELHFEQNAFFYDGGFAGQCERIFEEDCAISTEATKADFDRRTILRRLFGSFCKLFSPLM